MDYLQDQLTILELSPLKQLYIHWIQIFYFLLLKVMVLMHLLLMKKIMKRQKGYTKLTKEEINEVKRFKYTTTEGCSNSK